MAALRGPEFASRSLHAALAGAVPAALGSSAVDAQFAGALGAEDPGGIILRTGATHD